MKKIVFILSLIITMPVYAEDIVVGQASILKRTINLSQSDCTKTKKIVERVSFLKDKIFGKCSFEFTKGQNESIYKPSIIKTVPVKFNVKINDDAISTVSVDVDFLLGNNKVTLEFSSDSEAFMFLSIKERNANAFPHLSLDSIFDQAAKEAIDKTKSITGYVTKIETWNEGEPRPF